MTLLSAAICCSAAVAIYFALPNPQMPANATRPEPVPAVWLSDLIGFLIGVPLFSSAFLGMSTVAGSGSGVFFALLFPACLAIPVFILSVRQKTSWVRFVNNGFEITQMGLTARVRFDELKSVDLKSLKAAGGAGWLLSLVGGGSRRQVSLLSASRETKTLVFKASNGDQFSISCEVIPDLKRVLVGLDKAGVDLPHGFSERQRKRTKRLKEKLYGKTADVPASQGVERVDPTRIAETIRRYRERKLASGA